MYTIKHKSTLSKEKEAFNYFLLMQIVMGRIWPFLTFWN